MIRKVTGTLAVAAAAVAALAATAGTAGAAPHLLLPSVRATTQVTDRPDGGNGGTWADDTFTRTITITRTGGGPGAYTYTAKLTDTRGTFVTIKGALTPNQGGTCAGDVIKSRVEGNLNGSADFTFTASRLPDAGLNAGVPAAENDHGNTPADSTSTWYELAFPAGTTFGGAGIGHWSWTYKAVVFTFTRFLGASLQQWTDAWNNGDGDLPADGNIQG